MVTRKDIAERANVSVSVVSRALNNSGYVESGKKKRVLEIAEELGYHSNPIAMSLATRKTKQIIFFCNELKNAYNIEMYEGMVEAAKAHDYMVYIQGNMDFSQIPNIMADGIILQNEHVAAGYMNQIGKNYYIPIVSASFGVPVISEKAIPFVECDLWEGARLVEEYLWKHGHRNIAVAMPSSLSNDNPRIDAWKAHIKDFLGKKLEDYYIGIEGDGKQDIFEKGMLAAENFNSRKMDATAVICFNDEMALGFYKRIRKLGYQVPKDISIISYDGTYSRRYADIEMTTLSLNARLQGQQCVEILLKIINGEKYKHISRMPLKILEGESVRTIR